jgi:hypothetical protein
MREGAACNAATVQSVPATRLATHAFVFGRLEIVPNRFQRARDVLVLQMNLWAVGLTRQSIAPAAVRSLPHPNSRLREFGT